MTNRNPERAVIDKAKVCDYLLSSEHPVGRAKARFFTSLGFTRAAWRDLQRALLVQVTSGKAVPAPGTVYGHNYTVRGMLHGPAGRSASIVSVWIVLRGQDIPRFVTACPQEG